MLKIAICEDNHEIVSALKGHLERYKAEKEVEYEVQTFVKGSTFLAKEQKFDVVFMDVELQGESGIETAIALRKTNAQMPIVFISSTQNFAVKGCEADAVDFLTPPIGYYPFATMMDRVQLRLVKADTPHVAIMTKKGVQRISVDQIEYMEGGLNFVVYHLTDGDVRVHGSLNEEAKKVTENRFFRLRGKLLNLSHVNKVWGSDVYVGKACFFLPKKRKAEFLTSLLAFMNRG